MITNFGKDILGKYLIGQASAYASYLAVGCGEKPLNGGDSYGDYSTKQNLTFEMFRVPISSRGIVNDNGVNKIVLTAELPAEERYEITELGVYSAGSNPAAVATDSKTLLSFSSAENWQYHTTTASEIPTNAPALDAPLYDNVIAVTDPVFQTNSDNAIFYKTSRSQRFESCRFLNNTILISGDTSDISGASGSFTVNSGYHIHLTGTTIDLTKNSPTDELRFAFSIVNKDGDSLAVPDAVRILIEFMSVSELSGESAKFEILLEDGVDGVDFASNRYHVISEKLKNLITSSQFSWNSVNTVKIYASVESAGSPTGDYYVALDALRLENISSLNNPLYGLTGYTVIKNTDGTTVVKTPNTTNYVEFRFSIGVT